MIPRKMSWRWYTPKARSSVARQEFLDLPPHGQAALLSLMKRYAEHDSRPGMVARVSHDLLELRAKVGVDHFRLLFFQDSPWHLIVVKVFEKKTAELRKRRWHEFQQGP